MRGFLALALMGLPGVAQAQSQYSTAGGAMVPAAVVMCIKSGAAAPCVGVSAGGQDSRFVTVGGSTVGGYVRMCVISGSATPC
jgi:hypothetical protein